MNTSILNQLKEEIKKYDDRQKINFIDRIKSDLAKIDIGTFNVTKTENISNPLRFWHEEYRHFINQFQ